MLPRTHARFDAALLSFASLLYPFSLRSFVRSRSFFASLFCPFSFVLRFLTWLYALVQECIWVMVEILTDRQASLEHLTLRLLICVFSSSFVFVVACRHGKDRVSEGAWTRFRPTSAGLQLRRRHRFPGSSLLSLCFIITSRLSRAWVASSRVSSSQEHGETAALVTCDLYLHRGCFDEFNRLKEDQLSAVSQQIQVIQAALKKRDATCDLLGTTIEVNANAAIFVTMNPASKEYGQTIPFPVIDAQPASV